MAGMAQNPRKRSRFPETRWSLVGRAAASDKLTRQKALAELLVAYMPGLRAFLVEARRVPPDRADDFLQSFVADKVLVAGLVRHADQGKGKFRNFVLKSLNNFVSTKMKAEYASRTMTVNIDEQLVESQSAGNITDRFDHEWAQQVVHETLAAMQAECREKGRLDMWEVFRLRIVEPMVNDAEPVEYDQIIRRFDLKTPREAMNLLANAKRSFVRHLRLVVGRYVSDDDEIDKEIADLREIVGR